MRISYTDDEEFGGQFALWQANCRRSLAGKKGQAALADLEAALLAMPDKRLIEGGLACNGDVCAVGALILARRVKGGELAEDVIEDLENECDDTDVVAEESGIPTLVAWKLVEVNDITYDENYSEAERYEKVLAWVRSKLSSSVSVQPSSSSKEQP